MVDLPKMVESALLSDGDKTTYSNSIQQFKSCQKISEVLPKKLILLYSSSAKVKQSLEDLDFEVRFLGKFTFISRPVGPFEFKRYHLTRLGKANLLLLIES